MLYLLREHDFPGTQVGPSTEHGYKEFLGQMHIYVQKLKILG